MPEGLVLDTKTAKINGAPTTLQNATNYTITTSGIGNYSGEQTASIIITTHAIPITDLTYSNAPIVATVGTPINSAQAILTPLEADATYTITPSLPDGLIFDIKTGEISGTPTTPQKVTDYVVTAIGTGNYSGEQATNINITVDDLLDELYLDTTYVFFDGKGGRPRLVMDGSVSGVRTKDQSLSGGKGLYVNNWSALESGVAFAFEVLSPSEITISPHIQVANNGSTRIETFLELADNSSSKKNEWDLLEVEKNSFMHDTLPSNGTRTSSQWEDTFSIIEPGVYLYNMRLKEKNGKAYVGNVYGLTIKATQDSINQTILKTRMVRWRPYAAHVKFSNTNAHSNKFTTAIVEIRYKEKDPVRSYFPVTTPFGYFGSIWNQGKQRFGNPNFSLWSGSGIPAVGDISRYSYLMALSGNNATFGTFDHEGYGVKPRNVVDIFGDDINEHTQVFAVREEANVGETYLTYWSYLWDNDTNNWSLYASGRKYKSSGTGQGNIAIGSFLEVPGPPKTERSGHRTRRVEYRVWYVDTEDSVFPATHAKSWDGSTRDNYKGFGITDDGYFYMEAGGVAPHAAPGIGNISIPSSLVVGNTPEFLENSKVVQLRTYPIEMANENVSNVNDTSVTLNFGLLKISFGASINNTQSYIFYDTSDKFTFGNLGAHNSYTSHYPVSSRWAYYKELSSPIIGNNAVELNYLNPGTQYFYRILTVDGKSKVWSNESGTFTTSGEQLDNPPNITGIKIIDDDNGLYKFVGDEITLNETLLGENIADLAEDDPLNKVLWSSQDTSVATVDANGKVQFVGEGYTTIRVESVAKRGAIDTIHLVVNALESNSISFFRSGQVLNSNPARELQVGENYAP